LQVLDRFIALAVSELDVLRGHIHLEIDEGLAAPRGRDRAERTGDRLAKIELERHRHRRRFAARRCRFGAGAVAVLDGAGGRKAAHHRAGAELACRKAARNEAIDIAAIDWFDTEMRGKMHAWRPAAGQAD